MENKTTDYLQTPNSHQSFHSKKLYSEGWISAATYLGGPLGGLYMISKNFKQLNKEELASKTLRIGIIVTLVILPSILFLPEAFFELIPNSMIPLIYTTIVYFYMHTYQGKDIEAHFKNGGAKQSGWKAIGIAILSLIISLLYTFSLVMLLPLSMLPF